MPIRTRFGCPSRNKFSRSSIASTPKKSANSGPALIPPFREMPSLNEASISPHWTSRLQNWPKLPLVSRTLIADITAPTCDLDSPLDFIFSKMLAEHVRDARAFHRNTFKALQPGGISAHLFQHSILYRFSSITSYPMT